MAFLIGVIIFIVFCVIAYFYFRMRIRRILDKFGFAGMDLGQVIKEARLQDQEVPKSLSSMDSIYLESIKRDFPDIHISELKREAEKVILDTYRAVETKDSSGLKVRLKVLQIL